MLQDDEDSEQGKQSDDAGHRFADIHLGSDRWEPWDEPPEGDFGKPTPDELAEFIAVIDMYNDVLFDTGKAFPEDDEIGGIGEESAGSRPI